MSKEQRRRKYQHKQKQKLKDITPEKRVAHLAVQLSESPQAISALKRALNKTIKG